MNESQILDLIQGVLGSQLVQLVAALIILGMVPTGILTKIPFFGPALAVVLETWAKQKTLNFDAQRAVHEAEAGRIVRAKEQAIKTGAIDQTSAKAQATMEMLQAFNITPEVASRTIESEVNLLSSPIAIGQYSPSESVQ